MTDVVTRTTPVATPEPPPVATPAARRRREPPSLETLFTLLFAVAGWCVGLRRLGDNSFLWHWRTGHLILDRGIPHADPYSFTVPGIKWVAQSWLAELLYAVADRLAGGLGIRMLVALVGAGITALAFRIALRTARDRVRAALVASVALAALLVVWSERPLIFGLLGAAVLVMIVEFDDSWLGRHAMWTVPATMWLWANVHGTFSLGYVYLALHLVGRWADGAPFWEGRERRLAIASAVSVPVLLANPYGLSLLLFPIDLVRRGGVLNGVAEWNSPSFRHLDGMLFAAWLLLGIIVLARSRPSRRDVIVAVPFFFLALWALRNIGIATLVTVPIVGRACAARPRSKERSRLGWVFAAGLVALALTRVSSASAQPDFTVSDYPVQALHVVRNHQLMGDRLFTTDAWAGYVIARYWPAQHVYMDDRYDMYPKAVVDDYDHMANVDPAWRRTLDKWRIDVVVWAPKRSLSQALALDTDWVVIHRDKVAVVFVRKTALLKATS
jgi:hypothetical protein